MDQNDPGSTVCFSQKQEIKSILYLQQDVKINYDIMYVSINEKQRKKQYHN